MATFRPLLLISLSLYLFSLSLSFPHFFSLLLAIFFYLLDFVRRDFFVSLACGKTRTHALSSRTYVSKGGLEEAGVQEHESGCAPPKPPPHTADAVDADATAAAAATPGAARLWVSD